MLLDVLSEDMEKEEREAADIIQATANVKNAMALIPHELEAIKLTSKYRSPSASVAGDVSFTALRDRLVQTMPSIADDPDFLHIFELVVECGGDNNNKH